jgi:hypothetical protein
MGNRLMKALIFVALTVLAAAPCFAQNISPTNTPIAAGSVVAPYPVPSATATPVLLTIFMSNDGGNTWSDADVLDVVVGTTVMFKVSGATVPASLTMAINGEDKDFSTMGPLSFVATPAGSWRIVVDMPGYVSNVVVVLAR